MAENKKVIAVDLGGTNLRVSLVHGKKILRYIKNDTPKTAKELLKVLYESIDLLMSKDVIGIGVGSPGPLKDGVIKNPPNIPLKNFNLKEALEKKFKRPVVIENDVHCVALAEAKLGCKKKNFIVFAFGTGVGGGIVIDGKLYLGQGYAGELGHITLSNGKYLEELWQENARYIKEHFGKNTLIRDLIKMKNRETDMALESISDHMGQGIASAINIFDPEIVILNGGIKEAGDPMLDRIKKHVKQHVILPHDTPISWSKLNHPGTLGASLLIEKPKEKEITKLKRKKFK